MADRGISVTLCEVEVFGTTRPGSMDCAEAIGATAGTVHAVTSSCDSASSCDELNAAAGGTANWSGHGSDQVCGESDPDGNCELTEADNGFGAADDRCRGLGARLCTADEIAAGETRGTGCSYDGVLTWTSTPCGGGVYAVIGRGGEDPVCQTDFAAQLAVRCCADTVPDPNCDSETLGPVTTSDSFQLDSEPGVSCTCGPGLSNCEHPEEVIDGVIDPSSWSTAPNGNIGTCDGVRFGPNRLGLLTNALFYHKMALITSDCC